MSSFDAPSGSRHLKGPAPIPPKSYIEDQVKQEHPKRRLLPEPPSHPAPKNISQMNPERPSTLPRQPRKSKIKDNCEDDDPTRFHSIPRRRQRSPSGTLRGRSDPGRTTSPVMPLKENTTQGGYISSGPITNTPIINAPTSTISQQPPKASRRTSQMNMHSPNRLSPVSPQDTHYRSSSEQSNLLHSNLKNSSMSLTKKDFNDSNNLTRPAASRTDSGVSESSRYGTSDNSDYDQDVPISSFSQSLSSPRPRPRIPRSSTSITSGKSYYN